MTLPLRIEVSHSAAAQIEAAGVWWAINRPAAPRAIAEEIARGFALLAVQPSLGSLASNVRLRGIRRMYPSRIHYHIYYRVEGAVVHVLSFWHASRGSSPMVQEPTLDSRYDQSIAERRYAAIVNACGATP